MNVKTFPPCNSLFTNSLLVKKSLFCEEKVNFSLSRYILEKRVRVFETFYIRSSLDYLPLLRVHRECLIYTYVPHAVRCCIFSVLNESYQRKQIQEVPFIPRRVLCKILCKILGKLIRDIYTPRAF